MKKKESIVLAGSVAASFAVGATIALFIPGTAVAGTSPHSTSDINYPINNTGQSYGSAGLDNSPEEEPDLIAATATNGREGYVLKSELDQPATSLEDAARASENADRGYVIQVFLSDGTTPIGSFQVGGESSETIEK